VVGGFCFRGRLNLFCCCFVCLLYFIFLFFYFFIFLFFYFFIFLFFYFFIFLFFYFFYYFIFFISSCMPGLVMLLRIYSNLN